MRIEVVLFKPSVEDLFAIYEFSPILNGQLVEPTQCLWLTWREGKFAQLKSHSAPNYEILSEMTASELNEHTLNIGGNCVPLGELLAAGCMGIGRNERLVAREARGSVTVVRQKRDSPYTEFIAKLETVFVKKPRLGPPPREQQEEGGVEREEEEEEQHEEEEEEPSTWLGVLDRDPNDKRLLGKVCLHLEDQLKKITNSPIAGGGSRDADNDGVHKPVEHFRKSLDKIRHPAPVREFYLMGAEACSKSTFANAVMFNNGLDEDDLKQRLEEHGGSEDTRAYYLPGDDELDKVRVLRSVDMEDMEDMECPVEALAKLFGEEGDGWEEEDEKAVLAQPQLLKPRGLM
eukprot:gene18247-24700_t